ncbi:MAG: glycoside hydrolase family 15 protein [Thalassobaculales bacterium]
MSGLDLGAIGNCAYSALVDPLGRIVWCCLPRFDGDPVFSALVNGEAPEHGFYDVVLAGQNGHEQAYLRNSAVLRTVLRAADGSAVEIIDFAPRYRLYGRVFRPASLMRLLRPLAGTPRIQVRLRPSFAYGTQRPALTRGSNHCRYAAPDMTLRLTTDLPIAYVLDETPFLLEEPAALILGPDESLSDAPLAIGRSAFQQTLAYWQEWSRSLSIPFDWQQEVIRAAITLKLCSFEETGAIIAAMTTSVPEFAHSGRNWDYRFCWLRDAYFVVAALNRLGATRTMEHHIRYVSNIVANSDGGVLQPVYGLAGETRLTEWVAEGLAGYRGMGPVRVGNDAYRQLQNDIYGAAVLACTQSFFDQRFASPGSADLFARLEKLGARAVALFDQPDAGLWELRNSKQVHTFSAVMCWAAADRLARIARQLGDGAREAAWAAHAAAMHAEICRRAYDAGRNCFVATFGGRDMDASLLLLHELGFLAADDPRFAGTVEAVERELRYGDHMFRYVVTDDFGRPETAFNICTFWYINALASLGRKAEARRLFEGMLAARNPLGLMSEDLDPRDGTLWGNYPQTYSMVGLITAAMRLSRPWEDGF